MFVLEQPQCASPSSLFFSRSLSIVRVALLLVVASQPLSPTATHRPSDMRTQPPSTGGGGGGGNSSERAPFRGLWCVQMVVHREITRGCAQLRGYTECKTFGRPTPIRPMTLLVPPMIIVTFASSLSHRPPSSPVFLPRLPMQPVCVRQWDVERGNCERGRIPQNVTF